MKKNLRLIISQFYQGRRQSKGYSPVSILQVVELQTYQTGEGRTKQSIPINGILGDSGGIEIDIVNIAIEGAKSQPHLRTHLYRPLSPGCDWLQITDFPECVVVRDPVIPSALNVSCHQISSKLSLSFRRMFLEQMIRNLIGKASVYFLSVLVEQSQYHGFNVDQMVSIELFSVEEITEPPEYFLVGEDNFEQTVDHGMTKPEGGSGELV